MIKQDDQIEECEPRRTELPGPSNAGSLEADLWQVLLCTRALTLGEMSASCAPRLAAENQSMASRFLYEGYDLRCNERLATPCPMRNQSMPSHPLYRGSDLRRDERFARAPHPAGENQSMQQKTTLRRRTM